MRSHAYAACTTIYVHVYIQALAAGAPPPPQPRFGAHVGSPATAAASALWLHCLSGGAAAGWVAAEKAASLSGPPLMVCARTLTSWPGPGLAHVVVRLDVYNVTGLSYKSVQVGLAVSGPAGQAATEESAWSFPEGLSRPFGKAIEAVPYRSCTVVWRDLFVHALRPLYLSVSLEYDNVMPPAAMTPAAATPTGGADDVWSDDEDEESVRLRFACQPLALPLSTFFRPFRGFDSPLGSVFPPPLVFAACPHSGGAESISDMGLDLGAWAPAGFHGIRPQDACLATSPGLLACFAAAAFDGESLVCLLVRGAEQGFCETLEVLYYVIILDYCTAPYRTVPYYTI